MKYKIVLICMLAHFYVSGQISQNHVLLNAKISFECDSTMFPSSWLNNEINAKATEIDSVYINRSQEVLIEAFKKYPEEVLDKYLSKVYVVKNLEFFGLSYGGTNSFNNVYLCNRGFSDVWLEMAFHAEFSSLLYRQNGVFFQKDKWMQINDSLIVYGKSGVEALKKGQTSMLFSGTLNEKGILYEYGLSSFENDFNSYAENILLSRPEFWEIVKTYPKVLQKTQLVISFYQQISDEFSFDLPEEIVSNSK